MKLLEKKLNSLTYPQIISLGYLIVIVLGTLLLSLPISSRDGESAGIINSLFTATSATCVTGLVVYDTYSQWSLFGQLTILTLIQIGGLGFMTIVTMFSFLLKRKIGLKERGLLKESVNTMYIGGIVRLTKKILFITFVFETVGAIILSLRFIPKIGFIKGIYCGIFHSVSAFCNAGFDIMGRFGEYSSLTAFSGDAVVNLTIILLIVIGGIGFFVWDDLIKNKLNYKKYQIHTKIVLFMTFLLIFLGAVLFYLSEKSNLLTSKPFGEKLLISLFASVTPRTAGFNTVDIAAMSPGSKLLTMVLMFIGGSPGSTAGGIKTTTTAVVFISLWASLRNVKKENIFGRRLEDDTLKKASAIISVNTVLVILSTFLINISNSSFALSDVMFEVISALGTVGLSTGITGSLDVFAKIIIVLLMYSGRVGSLSLALIFTEHRMPSVVQYPTEKINLG